MNRLICQGRAFYAVGFLLLLGACANTATAPDRPGFPDTVAEKSFNLAYRQISDRYLESIAVGQLALEGLRGAATLDPLVSVDQTADEILLKRAGIIVAQYGRPAANDSSGWAKLTTRLYGDAKVQSAAISAAEDEQIYRAVFDGSLSLLDSFSRYAGARQALENRSNRSGFFGIGVKFRRHDQGAFIIELFPNSPAVKAGLRKNDIISTMDGAALDGLGRKQMRALFRGKEARKVTLGILREGQSKVRQFVVQRKRVIPPTVKYRTRNGIMVLAVSGFNRQTAASVAKHIKNGHRALGKRARGIVIDMRSNPGGLLKQSVKVADLFLNDGRIVATRGRHPESKHDYRAHGGDLARGLPIVVLVNGRSASASEIVAAALQDHERAIVVGTGSFGKGTVQSVTRLPNDGEMTLTWSRFVTPAGYILHGLGVPPSVCTSEHSGSAQQILDRVVKNDQKLASLVGAWRTVGSNDEGSRIKLRASCPADSRKRKVDMEIAEHLINDRQLYERVLGAAASPVLSAR